MSARLQQQSAQFQVTLMQQKQLYQAELFKKMSWSVAMDMSCQCFSHRGTRTLLLMLANRLVLCERMHFPLAANLVCEVIVTGADSVLLHSSLLKMSCTHVYKPVCPRTLAGEALQGTYVVELPRALLETLDNAYERGQYLPQREKFQ